MRRLSYAAAIREAHAQLLASDERVFVMGQGLWSPWYAGASLENLDAEFGRQRMVDSPVSESAVTGMAIGAALAGLRPIVFHPRMDFMLLAVDPIVNQAANWSYMFAGQQSVPLVIRAVVNRGGAQGAQHSQALHALFMHIPGLKVVMPSTAYDAKGLLFSALQDPNPVLYIDDRWLYGEPGHVPEEPFTVAIGQAAVRRDGSDVTLVGISYMAEECVRAAAILEREGVNAEVIDLRSLKPWDSESVCSSVRKTGLAVVADGGWRTAGAGADIAAVIGEQAFDELRAPLARVTLPDFPAPTAESEEAVYYPTATHIVNAVWELLETAAYRRRRQSVGTSANDSNAEVGRAAHGVI